MDSCLSGQSLETYQYRVTFGFEAAASDVVAISRRELMLRFIYIRFLITVRSKKI